MTDEGDAVVVDYPGKWNLGSGPDFLGAVTHIGSTHRTLCGDVEVHIRPSDWRSHGHGSDPRYGFVRFHVTFFPSSLPDDSLPPGSVRIALQEPLAADPRFSFDSIDPSVYPFFLRGDPFPCSDILTGWEPSAIGLLLEAAGEERLRAKTTRFQSLCNQKGLAQALYEESMSALGYRYNQNAFRRLAATVPLARLRDEAQGSTRVAYALLSGVAGLLPASPCFHWDKETRDELRALWDAWWKRRNQWEPACLPAGTWKVSGIRPANHPVRRLHAAAHWVTRPTPLSVAFLDAARNPVTLVSTALAWLDAPSDGYWSRRLSWGGTPQSVPLALVGKNRASAIFNNVVVPFLAVSGSVECTAAPWLNTLPAEAENESIRRMAHALFGPDHSHALYRSGLRQQGLLQIYQDYCLNGRSACSDCPLPSYLKRHQAFFHHTNDHVRESR